MIGFTHFKCSDFFKKLTVSISKQYHSPVLEHFCPPESSPLLFLIPKTTSDPLPTSFNLSFGDMKRIVIFF